MDSSRQVSQMLVQSDQYPELVGVRDVKALEGLRVRVVFTDGTERTLDLDPYLRGPLFEPIRRSRALFASVYVDPDSETLTWPNGADTRIPIRTVVAFCLRSAGLRPSSTVRRRPAQPPGARVSTTKS